MRRFSKSAALFAALLLCSANVSAEQPKAAEYRAMVESGRFSIEYSAVRVYADPKIQKKFGEKSRAATREIFAADGGRRALFSMGGRYGNSMAIRMENSAPVGKLFRNAAGNAVSSRVKMKLDLLYKEGKYYQFFGKDKALAISEDEAKDERTDSRAGWKGVMRSLSFPGFLPAFVANEKGEPHAMFFESGKEEVFGQPMAFDKYVMKQPEVSQDSSPSGKISKSYDNNYYVYKYYYDEKGELRYVKVSMESGGSGAQPANSGGAAKGNSGSYISIDKFTAEVPSESFEIPNDCKVYYIEPGSMNDLFGYGEQMSAAGKEGA